MEPDTSPRPVGFPFSLHGLLPPEDYAAPICPAPALGAFGLLNDENTPEVVGRVLGRGVAAKARWQHLASDTAACEAIKTSVMMHHIFPLDEFNASADPRERARVANRLGGEYCKSLRPGSEALLVHGTPGWDVCVLLAKQLAQRDGEAEADFASRCRRHHVWAAARTFEKAGIILLILRQAAALLAGANLYEGMPPYSLATLSPESLEAHLRVPSYLRAGRSRIELSVSVPQDSQKGAGGWGVF